MKNTDFNELAKRAFENARAKGFHDVDREDGHWFMLVVCELADAVIRLLDFMGLKKIDVEKCLSKAGFDEEVVNSGKKMSFAAQVYEIVSMLCFDEYVEYTMNDVFRLAYRHDIDLMWFVNEKMRYNETREVLHGKSY